MAKMAKYADELYIQEMFYMPKDLYFCQYSSYSLLHCTVLSGRTQGHFFVVLQSSNAYRSGPSPSWWLSSEKRSSRWMSSSHSLSSWLALVLLLNLQGAIFTPSYWSFLKVGGLSDQKWVVPSWIKLELCRQSHCLHITLAAYISGLVRIQSWHHCSGSSGHLWMWLRVTVVHA